MVQEKLVGEKMPKKHRRLQKAKDYVHVVLKPILTEFAHLLDLSFAISTRSHW